LTSPPDSVHSKCRRSRQQIPTQFATAPAEIRKRLIGLTEEDQILINEAPGFQEAERGVGAMLGGLNTALQNIRQIRQRIEGILANAPKMTGLPKSEILVAIDKQHKQALTSAIEHIVAAESVVASVSDTASQPGSAWARWKSEHTSFSERYKAAAERSTAHAASLRELAAIEERASILITESERVRGEIVSLAAQDAECDEARVEMENLRARRTGFLELQCQSLTERSGGSIRATIRRGKGIQTFVDALRQVLRGSGIRGARLDALSNFISDNESSGAIYNSLLSDLEALAVHHDTQAAEAVLPDTPTLAQAGFTTADVGRIARALTQAEWLRLSLIPLEDEPAFEYRAKENEYIPFANASVGQQATALLSTLLNSEGPPLIIDQPEEDLDNNVIQEIVHLIWSAKHKRQIVFASHNANLIVNGDADLVVWCSYRSSGDQSMGKIAGEGAIDIPIAKEAIKDIMEGGEAAFKLRRDKYGF